MNPETKNLQLLKNYNRIIVEKAHNQSNINRNYVFPKNDTIQQTESEAHDTISLQSKKSQMYNLHRQNIFKSLQICKHRTIVPIAEMLKQKIDKKNENKAKTYQNRHFRPTCQKTQSKQKSKKQKYLSLSQQKSEYLANSNLKNSTKLYGIKMTQINNQKDSLILNLLKKQNSKSILKKQFQTFTLNFFQSVKRISQKCFNSNDKTQRNNRQNQIIFHNSPKHIFSKQKIIETKKVPISERTTDTTSKIQYHNLSYKKNERKSFNRFNNSQKVQISPFTFS